MRTWRLLWRYPLYSLTVIVSLGIGLGVTSTVFIWLRSVLLMPLPGAADPARLVFVMPTSAQGDMSALSYLNYADLRSGAITHVAGMCAFDMTPVGVSGYDKPDRTWAMFVSGDFFNVLGVRPSLGRMLTSEDEQSGATVAVLSHAYWQRRFGGDPSVIGKPVSVNKQPVTIIGVAPPDFYGPYTGLSFSIYLPVSMRDSIEPGRHRLTDRDSGFLMSIARLKPGSSRPSAAAELSVLAHRVATSKDAASLRDHKIVLYPISQSPVGTQAIMGPVLMAMMGVVLFVLLIACANVATLMLVRSGTRRKEIALRMALGAGRGSLVGQFLAESALLSILGGAFGLFLAVLASH